MFWARIIVVICLLGCTLLSAQDSNWIRCRIVDAKSKRPIPFASIQLKGKHVGVVSNFEGDFQIPSRYRDSRDTLLISCIGYTTRSVALSSVMEGEVFIISLTESATVLNPVVISGGKKHRLTPNKIIKAAIYNIAYNCSRDPFTYQAYYRDYQIEDGAYVNLNEAIVQVEDSGTTTNDQLNTNIRLLQYRPNTEFKRDSTTAIAYDNTENKFIPSATIGNFGGNELMILRVHDPIRNNKNFSFSFIERLNRDFLRNHNFTFSDPVKRDDVDLYCIAFKARPEVSGADHSAEGKIYIERGNFAIHRIEYQAFETKPDAPRSLLYDVQLEYSRVGGMMHPNYISANNLFQMRNPRDFKVTGIMVLRELNTFVININNIVDPGSVRDTANYEVRADGKSLKVKEAFVMNYNEIHIALGENKHFNIGQSDAELSKSVRISFKNVRDMNGRLLNHPTYIAVNQFRELFVQQTEIPNTGGAPSTYMKPLQPLANQPTANTTGEIGYWMNTPLKGEGTLEPE